MSKARRRNACSLLAMRRFLAFLAIALAAPAALADEAAQRRFREQALERIETLSRSKDAAQRADAAKFLGGYSEADVIAALATALSDPEERVRVAAASALWKSEKAAEPARAALVKALADPAPAVAVRAAAALGVLGMKDAELAAARKRVLESPEARNDDRFMAARALVGHAPPATLLAPLLAFLAEYPTGNNAESTGKALERLAKTGDRALIAPLADALARARAGQVILLNTLAAFDPKPEGWTSTLLAALDSRDANVRKAAVALLGSQKAEKDVLAWAPRVAALLRDADSSVRSEALWSLGKAGGLAADQAGEVVAVLGDRDASLRRRAAVALGEMGDPTQAIAVSAKTAVAERARPALAPLAESDPDKDVREAAKAALAVLARSGAAVAAKTGEGRAGEAGAVALLRQRDVKMDEGSVFQALMRTDVPVVRAFLDAGLSPTASVAGNGAPLYIALQWAPACSAATRPTKAEAKAIVKLLLERGADVNQVDANGNTALMAAASHGCDRELMRTLLAAGARPDATNRAGLTAFEQGLAFGHDGLEELIAAGYRLPAEKARGYEQAYAAKPATLALVRKAARK